MEEETKNASSYSSDGKEDRISRLPDSLIHHIMSFNDTKYAVQTSVLSKRWIPIWKSLTFLNFNRSSFSDENNKRFIDFVYMVFIYRDDSTIQKFSVDWENSAYDGSGITNVDRWIHNALKYNVQEVSIEIADSHDSAYEIPHCLLNCKSLTKLVMRMWALDGYADIILPRSMNLPQLRVLILQGLSISNVELSKRLLSSCPVLELLELIDCDIHTDSQRNLIVDSVSLKKFWYACWYNRTLVNTIKLCAPNLKEFGCISFLTQDYFLENCSPLSATTLSMILKENEEGENAETYSNLPSEEKEVYVKRLMQFLAAVCMVKSMRLSSGFLEVFSRAPDLLDCQPLRLCNLEILTLEMWSTRDCLRAIAFLLSISPKITTIYLELKESDLADVGDDWEAGLSSPGMLSHLECVQMEEVEGYDAELKILSFFLKNAKVLKQVVLFFRSGAGSPDRVRQVEQFQDKLREVATNSSSAQLVFNRT